MGYININDRSNKALSNELGQPIGRIPLLNGTYVGFVKDTIDVQLNGRLRVWIPEMGSAPEDEKGWITVSYCSPFAGATNIETASRTNTQTFEGTQTSYGMWMIPPDINNQVVVLFINGDPAQGIWIGCMFSQYMNHMIPAMASDIRNYQYPSKEIPVAEYNKWDSKVVNGNRNFKPYQKTKFDGVGNQGLINDKIRGVTTSSARREAPSAVFGIITPGPIIKETKKYAEVRRKGGSSFVMDDGTGSEYVELATKSGSKIRLDETNGFVYIVNRDGTAWIEMDPDGNVDVFSANNISLRAQRDFNIRADRNVNIEAGQNIFLKAAKDTVSATTTFTYDVNNNPKKSEITTWKYVGEGSGTGGNIIMTALNNWHSTTQKNAYLTVKENNMDIKIGTTYLLTTDKGGQNFSSKMGIKMTTDAAYDLAAKGNIRIGTNSTYSLSSDADMSLCTSAKMSLISSSDMALVAGGKVGIDGVSLEVNTNTNMPSLSVSGTIKANQTDTGAINSRTVAIHRKPIGSGSPASPDSVSPIGPEIPQSPLSADPAAPAEVKPLNDKINILATWEDPTSKFKRKTQGVLTTVSRFPTFEPCPEHYKASKEGKTPTKPVLTNTDQTYEGSGASGSGASSQPPTSTDPGATNTKIAADPTIDNIVAKDFDIDAFKKQIKFHEGVKSQSYKDSLGLLTGGVGHLLRSDEAVMYPLGTPIPQTQVDSWLDRDITTSLKVSQTLFTNSWEELTGVRKRAIADLAYNLGPNKFAKFTKFIAAINAGKYDAAAVELKNSVWYTQVGRRGPNIVTMISKSIDPTNSGAA
jgi:lysozyme